MNDPYVYENGTLINRLNIKDYEKLKQAEADIGFLKLINIDSIKVENFDINLLKKIHHHIFENIYDWAGEFRTVPIVKEEVVLPGLSLEYADVKHVNFLLKTGMEELNNTLWNYDEIDELTYVFARKIALLWKIHPFRDGNTRTFLSFAYLFAKSNGFGFDISTFANELNRIKDNDGKVIKYNVRDKFVLASLDDKDYPEVEHLALLFKNAIKKYDNESIHSIK